MSDIIRFPDIAERSDRKVAVIIAEWLRSRGVSGDLAVKLSAEILADGRDFARRLTAKSLAFENLTEADLRLVNDAIRRTVTECQETWLEQRMELELRRLSL